ncbi:11857_t:CDS:2 [Acaulospora morrowiae]|uniref:11857_t:CDS:1 n=1 Tax=Acaulospora morrowiae TaxID=94023 RepID=A0A9N9AWQ6_9GLOM|nr:11857_t:CDS:2 [Acaulospora morrowiae]
MFNPSVDSIPDLVLKKDANNNKNGADADESEKKTFFYDNVLRAFKKNPIIWVSMFFIFLSTLFLLILLIGGTGAIYLSKFTFDDPIKFITKKNEISFTLYGYCVDDQCSQPSMTHNFDEIPSPAEITNGSSIINLKRFDPSDVGTTIEHAGSTVGSTVEDAGKNTVNEGKKIAEEAPGLLKSLLDGFANFKPKTPTVGLSGFFSLPYLFAMMFNLIALFFLYFQLNFLAVILLSTSTFLNFIALLFDLLLFVWIFELIAIIPGIGSQHTGPGIHLAGWSVIFLIIANILLCCRFGGNAVSGITKKFKKSRVVDENENKQPSNWV